MLLPQQVLRLLWLIRQRLTSAAAPCCKMVCTEGCMCELHVVLPEIPEGDVEAASCEAAVLLLLARLGEPGEVGVRAASLQEICHPSAAGAILVVTQK